MKNTTSNNKERELRFRQPLLCFRVVFKEYRTSLIRDGDRAKLEGGGWMGGGGGHPI